MLRPEWCIKETRTTIYEDLNTYGVPFAPLAASLAIPDPAGTEEGMSIVLVLNMVRYILGLSLSCSLNKMEIVLSLNHPKPKVCTFSRNSAVHPYRSTAIKRAAEHWRKITCTDGTKQTVSVPPHAHADEQDHLQYLLVKLMNFKHAMTPHFIQIAPDMCN